MILEVGECRKSKGREESSRLNVRDRKTFWSRFGMTSLATGQNEGAQKKDTGDGKSGGDAGGSGAESTGGSGGEDGEEDESWDDADDGKGVGGKGDGGKGEGKVECGGKGVAVGIDAVITSAEKVWRRGVCVDTRELLKMIQKANLDKQKFANSVTDKQRKERGQAYRAQLKSYWDARKNWKKMLNVGFRAGYCLGLCRVAMKTIFSRLVEKRKSLAEKWGEASKEFYSAKNNKDMIQSGFEC
jgi:hypothetical protein